MESYWVLNGVLLGTKTTQKDGPMFHSRLSIQMNTMIFCGLFDLYCFVWALFVLLAFCLYILFSDFVFCGFYMFFMCFSVVFLLLYLLLLLVCCLLSKKKEKPWSWMDEEDLGG